MSKKFWALLSLLLITTMILAACGGGAAPTEAPAEPVETQVPDEPEAPMEPVNITFWHKEGEADGGLQYIEALADAYTAEHPEVTLDVVHKDDVEVLREDFQTASLAGEPPDLLLTVNDHAGPFTAADLIMPVDDLVDLSQYLDSAVAAVELDGQAWGVPLTNGNHLMLLYNKSLIDTAPADTDELLSVGQELTDADAGTYALVYNQTEPFWLVPWLGGFNGGVFADDGVTPTLNTPEMVATLQFLHDMKFNAGINPAEADYATADTLFLEGKAAMIINGDWSVSAYHDQFGDDLGVAVIPRVSATGTLPAPYTSGLFFMIPEGLEGAELAAVLDFIGYATSEENQLDMVDQITRLPALKVALENERIANDTLLAGSAEQMAAGTPMPTVLEMRCNWDSMKPEMQAVLADTKSPEDAAAAMQAAAETCIAGLE